MTAVLTPNSIRVEDELTAPPVRRGVLVSLSAGIAVLCFVQLPGRIVADTKLDVAIAPLTFLGHTFYLWSPQQTFGGVPFQAYGYLLPMGPFFVLGHLFGLPTWVIQRLWASALLIAAFWGVVRLAEAMGIGSRWSRVIAALGFVVATPISLLGGRTDFILPFALLPWVMLPLVRVEHGGSARLAAARSGVAVLLIGGINAAATIAILPLPLLWFLTRTPGRRRRQLFAWWCLALFLACAWWGVSLLLEGRYGFNLLPLTESASTTTSSTALFDVLRGSSYWVAYDQIGPTAIRSGWEAITSPVMIISGAAVGALGLFGLAHRGLRERTWLAVSLAAGVVLVAAGYPGFFGAPFSHVVQSLLTGPLALFRNVWKFQPIVNLVLVLGFAHAIHVLSGPMRRGAQAVKTSRVWSIGRPFLVIPLAAAAVIGLAVPFLTDDFYPSGSFQSVPSYWQSAAAWLGRHDGTTTALVVPGSSVGIDTWGIPNDEPMQWLATTNWAVRNLIPDSSVGNIEMLDAVEQVLDRSVPNQGLAAFLAQAGVRYLVVRNDLAASAGAPTPSLVYENLSATAGLTPVASFGPAHAVHVGLSTVSLPRVEIYQVDGPVQTVVTAPVANSVVVSGGPSALLAMDQLGLDPGDRAVLLAGDGGVSTGEQTWVDTDTSPRIGVTYGLTRYNDTYVLTRGQVNPNTGLPPVGSTIVPGIEHQTVATFLGAKDVVSSSYGSVSLLDSPDGQPAAALDGDPDTAWIATATDNSIGQWIQVDFRHSINVSHVGITLITSAATPRVTQVTVTTAHGSLRQKLAHSGSAQVVRTPRGRTGWLRVTFSRVLPPTQPGALLSRALPQGAGISELSIPGVTVQKAEVVPRDELGRFSAAGARAPIYVFTSPTPGITLGARFGGDDSEPRMVRLFATPRQATYEVRGTVMPRPGADLLALLRFLGPHVAPAKPLDLACGKGPPITVDGVVLPTQVTGTYGALSRFRQMSFSACGHPLNLSVGRHTLEGNNGGFLKVTSVLLSPSDAPPYASSTSRPRTVAVKEWGPEHRSVAIGAGAASYLIVRQNFNSGWTAQLGGRSLQPERVNGWEQAWVVPSGSGGTVTLTYGPDVVYQLGLVVGAVLALLLLVLALWPSKRKEGSQVLARRPSLPTAVVAVGATVVLVILGGVLALILPVLLAVVWLVRSSRWLPALAALAYFAAGLAVAVHVGTYPATGIGAFGRPAQMASMIALTAVLSSLVADRSAWAGRGVVPGEAEGRDGPASSG